MVSMAISLGFEVMPWFSVGAGGKISSAKSRTGSSSKPSKTHTTSAPSPLMTWQ